MAIDGSLVERRKTWRISAKKSGGTKLTKNKAESCKNDDRIN